MELATKKPRYTVSVDEELFQQIEDYRFKHRFQTRSEATVELIRLGLKSINQDSNNDNDNKNSTKASV